MANPAPTINQINAFNATQGTTIDFNIIGGTELIRSNRIYIYDLSDNSLICTHLYVSTESIHELPPNTDGSIVYESGKSSADFVNGAQYYAQIQTYTDTNGTQGGSGLSVAKMFWCLVNPTLTITTIPSTISTTSYNISATYTDTSASVVSNIIQQYQFNLYSATGSLLQSSGVVVGSGTQQGTSDVYDISYNFTGLNVGSSYYVTVNVTTTQGMSVTTQSNTFTVSIDTPTLGEATVVNNACDGYISVTSNLSGEYGGSGSGEIVSFETDSENVFSKLQVDLEPIQNLNDYSYPWVGGAGKNKLQIIAKTSTVNGITFTVNGDGSVTINGTSTANNTGFNLKYNKGVLNLPVDTPIVMAMKADKPTNAIRIQAIGTESPQTIRTQVANESFAVSPAFTIDSSRGDTATWVRLQINSSGTTIDNVTVYPMWSLASDAPTEWEPYENICPINGQDEASASVVGKNFLEVKKGTSGTSGGVTTTINEDGSITLNGTATSNAVVIGNLATGLFGTGVRQNDGKKHIPNGQYIITTGVATNTGVRLQLYGTNQSSGTSDVQAIIQVQVESTLTIDDTYAYNYARLFVEAGTYNNVTIRPMIRLASETDSTYEPYNAQTTTQDFNATLTPTSTDTTPYSFKAVGDVYGDRLEDKIVGGTVAWNQMGKELNATNWIAESGVTVSFEDDVMVVSSTTANNGAASVTYPTFKNGNKYLVTSKVKTETDLDDVIVGAVSSTGVSKPKSVQAGQWVDNSYIAQSVVDGTKRLYCYARNTQYSNLRVKDVMVFDLTQMFGSTIADYIYSLEQATAGAGVAWFKKLFPKDYYAYNAGELLSVGGLQSHDTVGFNQWDEEWELGIISPTTGGDETASNRIRSKGYNRCVPHTDYYIIDPVDNSNIRLIYYNADKVFIGESGWKGNQIITTPSNAYYFRFYCGAAYGTTYNHDICINLSNPSRNGEYEPYEKHSYPLDSSLTLRGIPKLDASNNLYYDGDEYTSDGKVKRKYGVVDLGTLTWTYVSAGTRFSAKLPEIKTVADNNTKANIVCPLYVTGTPNDTWNSKDKVISANINSHVILVRDTAYTDATAFKSAMSGVMLVYELATPTTETATPYTNPQIVSKYGTLEYVTNSIVPVGHKTTYLTRDIFGGYVDLISGKLVVDRVYKALNGTEPNVMWHTWGHAYSFADLKVGNARGLHAMSNQYKKGYDYWSVAGTGQIMTNVQNILIMDDRYNTVADWNAYVKSLYDSGNPIQIVYELETPQTYQLTPQQVNTLVGTNNVWSEQGNIELSYHIPITNLLVKRQDVDDVGGGWLTLYSQPISQASDMDFTFIDFLNQYGKTYKYALVPLLTQTQSGVEVEVEGGYTVSNEVQSVFDGVFIADSTGSQKCKANVGYGNVDMNQVVGSITPIGAKYPIIITNSHNQYHNGSISGTIVPDDYYFNGNLSRIDMVNKRNELEQFLTNKRVKVIKDWNGNIWLVMIAGNVSCTFNNNYGMGIVSFSTNWTEVGDPTNQQDLQATGLINVGGV